MTNMYEANRLLQHALESQHDREPAADWRECWDHWRSVRGAVISEKTAEVECREDLVRDAAVAKLYQLAGREVTGPEETRAWMDTGHRMEQLARVMRREQLRAHAGASQTELRATGAIVSKTPEALRREVERGRAIDSKIAHLDAQREAAAQERAAGSERQASR